MNGRGEDDISAERFLPVRDSTLSISYFLLQNEWSITKNIPRFQKEKKKNDVNPNLNRNLPGP